MTRIEQIKARAAGYSKSNIAPDIDWLLERNAELLKALKELRQEVRSLCEISTLKFEKVRELPRYQQAVAAIESMEKES